MLVNKKYTLIYKLYESSSSKIFVGAFMKNGKQVTRIIKLVISILFSNQHIHKFLVAMQRKYQVLGLKIR